MTMLPVSVEENCVRVGERLSIFFLRTLRVPEDGKTYPLPPGLGEFPVHRVQDHASRVPADWLDKGGVFIPLYQHEALWLGFEAAWWKPNAVKVGVGGINAITGGEWDTALNGDPQDYVVCPPQPWLDGINAGSGVVRQFVATRLGLGDTIESQLTSVESGGLQLVVFEPRAGLFPDEPPVSRLPATFQTESAISGALGLGAGGQIQQKIYVDHYGLDTWDTQDFGSLWVHILNSEQYRAVTGIEPPSSPIDAMVYTQYGFPWFQVYDEGLRTVPAPGRFARVKGLRERHAEREETFGEIDRTVIIPSSQVRPLEVNHLSQEPENEESDLDSE